MFSKFLAFGDGKSELGRTPLFGRDVPSPALNTLLAFPLKVHTRCRGVLVFGHRIQCACSLCAWSSPCPWWPISTPWPMKRAVSSVKMYAWRMPTKISSR